MKPPISLEGSFGTLSKTSKISSRSALGSVIFPDLVGTPLIGANRLQPVTLLQHRGQLTYCPAEGRPVSGLSCRCSCHEHAMPFCLHSAFCECCCQLALMTSMLWANSRLRSSFTAPSDSIQGALQDALLCQPQSCCQPLFSTQVPLLQDLHVFLCTSCMDIA